MQKKLLILLCYILGIILGIGLLVVIVDPYYHFHKPLGQPYVYSCIYQTPGMAKNMEYDTAIVGSSMTDNFRASWFEEIDKKCIKLSYSGARVNDLCAILDAVYDSGNEVGDVIMDLNIFQLDTPITESYVVRPEYLYDDNPLNDLKYILNKDVVLTSAGRIPALLGGDDGNWDEAYVWEDDKYFDPVNVWRDYHVNFYVNSYDGEVDSPEYIEKLQICRENMAALGEIMEEHPETHFSIFYPQYSVLYFKYQKEAGLLEYTNKLIETSMKELLRHDNVTLYYFWDEFEYMETIENYRDINHYKPDANRYIFECMVNGDKIVTEDVYEERLQMVYEHWRDYDYASLVDLTQ